MESRGGRQNVISIPRALAGPDAFVLECTRQFCISIPRALAGPDDEYMYKYKQLKEFQSPGPSQAPTANCSCLNATVEFQSPGPSQAPTGNNVVVEDLNGISIPRALAGPDRPFLKLTT